MDWQLVAHEFLGEIISVIRAIRSSLLFRQFLERFLNAQVFLLQSLDDEAFLHRPPHQVGADVSVVLWLENPVVALHALHATHLRDAVE